MAEDALQQLIGSDDEKKRRIALFKAYPALYDKLIKKLEAVRSSNPSLKKVESILDNIKQDTATLRAEKEAEEQEIKTLHALLVEKGVSRAHLKNAKDLKALLEPNESIECAIGEGQRGTMVSMNDYSLYTNKSIYILRGLANHERWGSITKMGYDAIHDVEDAGILIKKKQVSGIWEASQRFFIYRRTRPSITGAAGQIRVRRGQRYDEAAGPDVRGYDGGAGLRRTAEA
jgi:hypothetical protein